MLSIYPSKWQDIRIHGPKCISITRSTLNRLWDPVLRSSSSSCKRLKTRTWRQSRRSSRLLSSGKCLASVWSTRRPRLSSRPCRRPRQRTLRRTRATSRRLSSAVASRVGRCHPQAWCTANIITECRSRWNRRRPLPTPRRALSCTRTTNNTSSQATMGKTLRCRVSEW